MSPRFAALLLVLAALLASGRPAPLAAQAGSGTAAGHWPTKDGSFDIPNYRFGTGETLPKLHLNSPNHLHCDKHIDRSTFGSTRPDAK